MSCLAPVLYGSTDCSRWLAEYKQGILQRKATRRLRAAKYRLTTLVHPPAPVHHYPTRHRLSPLESLHRFQIDCGDLDDVPPPMNAAVIPPMPVEPALADVSYPEFPPELPPPSQPVLTPEVPTLINVPVTPVENLPSPTVTPEPASLLYVLTGAAAAGEILRRRAKDNKRQASVSIA